MQNVQSRGFLGESFLEKVLWDLWIKRQYDPMGYVEGVLDLAMIDTPDDIKKDMGVDLGKEIDDAIKELDYFEGKRQGHNPIKRKSAGMMDEMKVQVEKARIIEHALVNAYFKAGFLFRRNEFTQRSFT